MRSGEKPAQCAASYESQKVCPGTQNCAGGLVNGEVWPISQTKEFGVSNTRPQPSALPMLCVSQAGINGPSCFEFITMVPSWPVARSVTVTWTPSAAGVG